MKRGKVRERNERRCKEIERGGQGQNKGEREKRETVIEMCS